MASRASKATSPLSWLLPMAPAVAALGAHQINIMAAPEGHHPHHGPPKSVATPLTRIICKSSNLPPQFAMPPAIQRQGDLGHLTAPVHHQMEKHVVAADVWRV